MYNWSDFRWSIHNLIMHPLSEIIYLVMRLLFFGRRRSENVAGWIHDLVQGDTDNGRG